MKHVAVDLCRRRHADWPRPSLRAEPLYPDVVNTSHATPRSGRVLQVLFHRQERAQAGADDGSFLGSAPDLYRRGVRLAVLQQERHDRNFRAIHAEMAADRPVVSDPHQRRHPFGLGRLHRHAGIVRRRDPHPRRDRLQGRQDRALDRLLGRPLVRRRNGGEDAHAAGQIPDQLRLRRRQRRRLGEDQRRVAETCRRLCVGRCRRLPTHCSATTPSTSTGRLRARILGKLAIGKYLARVLATAPYGKGANSCMSSAAIRAAATSGPTTAASVKRGIVAIDLNSAGQIERLDTTWDNGVMSDADLQALVLQSIEK